MASSWGGSWGGAWGDSWGALAPAVSGPTQTAGGAAGGGGGGWGGGRDWYSREKVVPSRRLHAEDADMLEVIITAVTRGLI